MSPSKQSLLMHLWFQLSQSLMLNLPIFQLTALIETSLELYSVEQNSLNAWDLRMVWKQPGLRISYWKKLEVMISNSKCWRNSLKMFNQLKLWAFHSRSPLLSNQETTPWDYLSDTLQLTANSAMKSASKSLPNKKNRCGFKLKNKLLNNLSNPTRTISKHLWLLKIRKSQDCLGLSMRSQSQLIATLGSQQVRKKSPLFKLLLKSRTNRISTQ